MRELHLYKLKVDYISDSTTNVERALKMESVMSSFRLFMATSIGARQPQSVQDNLNLCKTTSIRAQKKNQKVTAYFRRLKPLFEPEIFSLARGYI